MILLLLMALGGTFFMSLMSAKEYLANQLKIKNIDDANSLALSLSQMDKDKIDIELIITAQFDAGHYEYIMFNDQHKKPIAVRRFENAKDPVPQWFSKWINLDVAPGVALIQDGWQQYGSIIVKSHSSFAMDSLWRQAKNLLEWFMISSLLAGLFGILVFRRIANPLNQLIEQAEAISERRFISSPEPGIAEFKRLAKSMNLLSANVKTMLEKDTAQLQILRRESLIDSLTELNNRSHFLSLLDNTLTRDDSENFGVIILCRVLNLRELNAELGRNQADEILKEIAQAFHYLCQQHTNSYAGRLNGSDFAIVIPTIETMESITTDLVQRLNFQLIAHNHQQIAIPMAVIQYHSHDERHKLMHNLDGALAQAEIKGDHAVINCVRSEEPSHHRNLSDWRHDIHFALDNNLLSLGKFSVQNTKGDVLHMESPLRMKMGDEEKTAGYFIPWASRLNLLAVIDLAVVKLALNNLSRSATPLAINVSASLLSNSSSRDELLDILGQARDRTNYLWIEFPETSILRYPNEFRSLVKELRKLGCKVGLKHAGLEFIRFEQLQDIGMHYLKIDSAIIRQIDQSPNNRTFVQSLCQLGHSLGIIMIAEGVTTENEKSTLIKIGADAFTGPLIS